MKYLQIIFMLFFFGCATTDEKKFLDKEKILLDKILLSDINHFDTLSKDTFIVSLRPFIWCGNDKGTYVDGNPLFDNVKQRATIYGFKKILLDTADQLDINKKPYKHYPHYSLDISIQSDKGHVQQTYYYQSGPKVVQIIKDTTIEL